MILKHIAKHGHREITPTVPMLRHWWGRINQEVFGGTLMPCKITFGKSEWDDVAGVCYGLDNARVHIHVDKRTNTRVGMIVVMAHEMVHQWQHQHGHQMNHGSTFKAWADDIKDKVGLLI